MLLCLFLIFYYFIHLPFYYFLIFFTIFIWASCFCFLSQMFCVFCFCILLHYQWGLFLSLKFDWMKEWTDSPSVPRTLESSYKKELFWVEKLWLRKSKRHWSPHFLLKRQQTKTTQMFFGISCHLTVWRFIGCWSGDAKEEEKSKAPVRGLLWI